MEFVVAGLSVAAAQLVVQLLQWLANRRPEKAIALTPQKSVKPKRPLHDLLDKAKQELGIDYVNKYNFAVCGSTGVGKSTFINCILQLQPNAVARTDVVQSTSSIKGYSNPQYPSVVLWDMPGSDAPNHPAKSYFMDNMLYAFDCILILTSGSFRHVDSLIAAEAKLWNKPFVMVRTKADVDVTDISIRQMKSMDESARILREAVKRSFDEKRLLPKSTALFIISCFALSNHNPYGYSFPAMDEKHLLRYMCDSIKPRFSNYTIPMFLQGPGSTSQQ